VRSERCHSDCASATARLDTAGKPFRPALSKWSAALSRSTAGGPLEECRLVSELRQGEHSEHPSRPPHGKADKCLPFSNGSHFMSRIGNGTPLMPLYP